MKIGIKKEVEVDAKELRIYTKVCDCFTATLFDQDGKCIHEQDEGHVPSMMPGEHYGDYIILNIDIDTGYIKNWRAPTKEQIEDFIKGEDE